MPSALWYKPGHALVTQLSHPDLLLGRLSAIARGVCRCGGGTRQRGPSSNCWLSDSSLHPHFRRAGSVNFSAGSHQNFPFRGCCCPTYPNTPFLDPLSGFYFGLSSPIAPQESVREASWFARSPSLSQSHFHKPKALPVLLCDVASYLIDGVSKGMKDVGDLVPALVPVFPFSSK